MSKQMKLEGAMVALVTPFADGRVDFKALDRLVDWHLEQGTQALVPCGTTGESPTLDYDEHDAVIERTCRRAAGRVPVIAGTGSNSTAEAVMLTKHAKDAGADATLQVNPYYNKPTQAGCLRHIEEIDKIGLPIILYNIPSRTGVELTVETMVRAFSQFENVVAVKEATGKLNVTTELARACDITILSGDDNLTLPIMACGGRGVISVLGNILPREIRILTDLCLAGDLAAARQQHFKLYPLFAGVFVETNPIPIKAAMAMAGLIRDEIRLPMTPLSPQHRGPLAALLRQAGVTVEEVRV
jgi:4-hydroxy-tetrahydrodipicolinate synthase